MKQPSPTITMTEPLTPIITQEVPLQESTNKFSLLNYLDLKLIWLITIIFALEVFFKYFTSSLIFSKSYVFIILFSISYGSLIYLILSFIKKKKLYYLLFLITILLISILYITNDLLYSQFKVFYDTETVLAGAKDVLMQYRNEIKNQVLSFTSIKKILFYLMPLILYSISFAYNSFKEVLPKQRLTALFTSIISFLLALILIQTSPTHLRSYKDEYNFTNAIKDYGLLSALRLDLIRKTEVTTFDEEESIEEASTIENRPVETENEKEIIIKDNILEIDFDNLSKDATNIEKQLDEYVSSITPSTTNEYTGLFAGKNLIMITAEAFSKEVINKDLTPTLYRLATKGINFTDYYQPASAGTTGGEYEVLFGAIPTSGGRSLKNTQNYHNIMTIASQLSRLGYEGWAFHNNDYQFYDRHLTHNNLGYSNGFMGMGNGMEAFVENVWPQSDAEMFEGTFPLYSDTDKFNVYYMSVSGHSGYNIYENKMTEKNWERVKDLAYSDRVKGYIAANLELEDGLTYLVNALEEKGIADDTVIVLTADHFPYGLDDSAQLHEEIYLSELYGYNLTNYLERDHSALIIWSKSLEDNEPIIVDKPVSSLDILPTLSNLFGTNWDSRLFVGRDVFSNSLPLVFNANYDWKTDKGYYLSGSGTIYPNNGIEVDDNYIENIRTIVRNKMTYCDLYNTTDYFHHLFPDF